jgi:hypothetical protein
LDSDETSSIQATKFHVSAAKTFTLLQSDKHKSTVATILQRPRKVTHCA